MTREFKVNELAREFGVHRNTIRNWIRSGTLPARKSPGRRYLVKLEDYHRLCEKYGKTPQVSPEKTPAEPPPPRPAATHQTTRLADGRTDRLYTAPELADTCLACGSCSNACPLSGVDAMDPGKLIRMAFLGMNRELIASDWPWKCTLCGKCEQACPMNIEITRLILRIRARRDRNEVPGPLHKGVATRLKRGNNLGIPAEDFLSICKQMGEELARQSCPGFVTPIERHGARLLVSINSRDLFVDPTGLKWWWKIFHAAGESWTLPADNWDGVNWSIYTGDEQAMQTIVGRLVDNMERLGCEALLLPD